MAGGPRSRGCPVVVSCFREAVVQQRRLQHRRRLVAPGLPHAWRQSSRACEKQRQKVCRLVVRVLAPASRSCAVQCVRAQQPRQQAAPPRSLGSPARGRSPASAAAWATPLAVKAKPRHIAHASPAAHGDHGDLFGCDAQERSVSVSSEPQATGRVPKPARQPCLTHACYRAPKRRCCALKHSEEVLRAAQAV